MKKIVYVCGDEDYSGNCEINSAGRWLSVEANSDGNIVGIDLFSMIEIVGDMVEIFVKKGGARPDTVECLDELVNVSRECLARISKGKVVS